MLRELVTATEEFNLIQLELADLYKQDKYGVYKGQALLVSENTRHNWTLNSMALFASALFDQR